MVNNSCDNLIAAALTKRVDFLPNLWSSRTCKIIHKSSSPPHTWQNKTNGKFMSEDEMCGAYILLKQDVKV